jgi:type II secretory pathway predicted ATPase ExeA
MPSVLGTVQLDGVTHQVHNLAELIALLRVSQAQAARAMRMPRATAYRLLHLGEWPARMSDDMLSATGRALISLCMQRGLSKTELVSLVRTALPVDLGDLTDMPADAQTPPTQSPKPPIQKEEPMLMAKQTLSPAARKAFTLFTNPFDGEVIDDSQMFTNGEIAYVREACMQAAVGGRFVAVVSESGGGKTTMLGDLEARIQRDRKPVLVIKPWVLGMEDNDTKGKTLKSTDILASVVTTLDPLATVRQTLQGRSNQARDLLVKSTEAGYSHLLVIEEAHSLPEATLKHLKRLHEMRLGRKPLLGILLLGQTELALKLDPRRASLREVTQRCEVVHLLPLDGDLRAYLDHRAKAAGRDLAEFMDQSGVDELRTRLTITRPSAGGKTAATSLLYPLAVNNLVTAALNVAAELGVPMVTRDVVRAV